PQPRFAATVRSARQAFWGRIELCGACGAISVAGTHSWWRRQDLWARRASGSRRGFQANSNRPTPLISGPNDGWRREAGTLCCQPFPKDRYFFERKVSRRTHEVVGARRVDCPTRYCESTHRDFVTDHRPPGERESLTSFGG